MKAKTRHQKREWEAGMETFKSHLMTKPCLNCFKNGLKWFSTHGGCWRWASVPQSRAAHGKGFPPPSLVQRRDHTLSKNLTPTLLSAELCQSKVHPNQNNLNLKSHFPAWKPHFARKQGKASHLYFPSTCFPRLWPGWTARSTLEGKLLVLQLPFPSINWKDSAPPGSRSPLPSSIHCLHQMWAGTGDWEKDNISCSGLP